MHNKNERRLLQFKATCFLYAKLLAVHYSLNASPQVFLKISDSIFTDELEDNWPDFDD